jgi:hypothetical protein
LVGGLIDADNLGPSGRRMIDSFDVGIRKLIYRD